MTQLDRITASATAKNLPVYFDNYEQKELVGIENKNHIVYWFEYSESGVLLFNHAYNRNSGKTLKGINMGYNFLIKLLNN